MFLEPSLFSYHFFFSNHFAKDNLLLRKGERSKKEPEAQNLLIVPCKGSKSNRLLAPGR